MVCLWYLSPRGWGCHIFRKDANNDEQPSDPSYSRMKEQIPTSARSSKYTKCGLSHTVASLPETSTFVIRLHLPKCRQNVICFNLEHTKPLKRTHKYHISLQIRTDGCFECRSFPPLKTCTCSTIFRERHATLSSTAYRHSIWVKHT